VLFLDTTQRRQRVVEKCREKGLDVGQYRSIYFLGSLICHSTFGVCRCKNKNAFELELRVGLCVCLERL
jgi:hypothetical protein